MRTTQKRVRLMVRQVRQGVWEIDIWPEDWVEPISTISVHDLEDAAGLGVALVALGLDVRRVVVGEGQDTRTA